MEIPELIQFCLKNGLLIDKEVMNMLSETLDVETSKMIIEKLTFYTQKKLITRSVFSDNRDKLDRIFLEIPSIQKGSVEKFKIKLGLSIEISKEVLDIEKTGGVAEEARVKILTMNPSLSKKIEVKDFVNYFKGRYNEVKGILRAHSELDNPVSINKISGNKQGICIIGIIWDKRITKNKNILLDLEDLTGRITVLVSQNNKELYERTKNLALDSVIGVKGSGSREIIFANSIVLPESRLFERKKAIQEEFVLFSGDLHVGSRLFMEDKFLKFIDYLNGNVPNTPEVKKIKYLFLVGDIIAGVGIHPNQEKELVILDVEEQYLKAAELLGKINKDITIIISPGNHDALRIMEPQPVLDEKYAWPLYELKNVVFTGNPSLINIGAKKDFSGMNVLTYHGYSFHYYANNIEELVKEKAAHKPEKIMAYLLKNGHLAPTHASTLYFPSEDDPFLIKNAPDIFLAGHTHKSAVAYYNNILMISSSTWESLTAFQEKMGNEPDFCKVPMFNMKTREVRILDFE